MVVTVSVRHNLRLVVRTVDTIKPKILQAMRSNMEGSVPYLLGQYERNSPPEAKGLAERMQYRIDSPDPETVRGYIFTQTDPMEAFLALEFGRAGTVIKLDKAQPIIKKEGESADKPTERMSRKEREDWEKNRIVWTKTISVPEQPPRPWLIPIFRATFPEIVKRLRNNIANRFEEIGERNARVTPD